MRFRYGRRSILECPPEIQARLTAAGGRNPFGDPNYKIEWGFRHLDWVNGFRPEFYEDGPMKGEFKADVFRIGREPQSHHTCKEGTCFLRDWKGNTAWELYPEHQYERWQFLIWKPAAFYGSPEDWYSTTEEFEGWTNIAPLGPYPTRGCYEISHTIESSKGEFVALSPRLVEHLLDMVKVTHARTKQQIRDQINSKIEERRNAGRRKVEEILGEEADVNPNLVVGYRPQGQAAVLGEKKRNRDSEVRIPFREHAIQRMRLSA